MRGQTICVSHQLKGRELAPRLNRDALACVEELLIHRRAIHVRARMYAHRGRPNAATMAIWIAEDLVQ